MQFSESHYFRQPLKSTPSTQIEAKPLEKEKQSTSSEAKVISMTVVIGWVCLMMMNQVFWVESSENQVPSTPPESSNFIPKNPY